MRLNEIRVRNWLTHFGLIQKEMGWNDIHVSGHGSGDQIRRIIEGTRAKTLIPIQTEHEEYHTTPVLVAKNYLIKGISPSYFNCSSLPVVRQNWVKKS